MTLNSGGEIPPIQNSTAMTILTLAIKKKWFDLIKAGEKKEEYREIKPYYTTRFHKPLTHIRFTNGYGNSVPSVTVELLGISKGIPKPEWSKGTIEQGTEVYVLSLGDVCVIRQKSGK